jgi:protein-S-isoprenylcysteine O-methyltransferase Ste14
MTLAMRIARLRARVADLSGKARSALAEVLARRRVPLGFAAAAGAFWLARPTRATIVAGALVAAAGQALRLWAAGHLEKGREVTRSGPYRLVRHPLYAGSTLMGIGFAIASANVGAALLVAAYLGLTLAAAIRTEEAYLRTRFGGQYDAYREGTATDAVRRFSFHRAFRVNREHRALIGLTVAIALLVAKASAR